MRKSRGIKPEDSVGSDLNVEIAACKKVGRIYGSMDLSSTRTTDSKCDLKGLEEEAIKNARNQSDSNAYAGTAERQRVPSDDLSENHSSGSAKRKFVKVNARGEEDLLQEKIFENDINYIFTKDKSKFIGEFKADQYKIIRGYINGSKHLRLYYTKLENYHTRIASIAIIHGYGEHSGRFLEMAEHFVKEGFVVHLIDLRGSGFSGGSHGVASVDELHEDIKLLLQQAGKDLPLFLYGHSLGASLIASLLIRNKWLNISGVILTSAMFEFAQERKINHLKRFFIRLFGGYFEEVVISGRISNTHLTKNNYQIKKIVDDRVSSPFVTLRMAKNAIELMDYIKANVSRFRYPALIIHGYEDKITRCQESVRFYNKISSTEKRLKIFVEGFHELHHDIEKEKLKSLMTEWMKQRLESKTSKKFGILENVKLGLKRKGLGLWQKFALLILTFFYFYFLQKYRQHLTHVFMVFTHILGFVLKDKAHQSSNYFSIQFTQS